MKHFLYIFIFFAASLSIKAQEVERKIIIVNNRYYFTTIDPEFQIGTLHTGKVSEPLSKSVLLALPAGRNYADPIIPFSWDLYKGNFYGINFLAHPLNDRNEAIKKIAVTSLKAWSDKISVMDMIMKSVDAPMLTTNEPYAYIIKKSNTMDHFFYDGIAMSDSSYYMAICNNGEISVWNFNGKMWTHGADQKFSADGYFSLTKLNGQLYLASADGSIYSIKDFNLVSLKNKHLGNKLEDVILIENRDSKTISFIKSKDLNNAFALDKQISKKGIKLF